MKKLKLFNKYFIKIDKNNFNEILNSKKFVISNVKYHDSYVSFFSNIEIENTKCTNIFKFFLKKVILQNSIFILSLLFICFIFMTSSKNIREIRYSKDSIKDSFVYNYIEGSVYNFVNKNEKLDLNKISKRASVLFSHYAFISLKKEGSILYLKIQKQDTIKNKYDFIGKKGNFISTNDAYIEKILIERGLVTIGINQVVKKGDLLVSGNLLYNKNEYKEEYMTMPKGVIIGKVIEIKEYNISKKHTINSFSGNTNTYTDIYLFNTKIKKTKSLFNNKIENITFNIGSLLKIVEVTEYEKKDYDFVYEKNNIIEYVKSLINYELDKNKVSDFEKINDIKILQIIEENDNFKIKVLVDKSINIVTFQEVL